MRQHRVTVIVPVLLALVSAPAVQADNWLNKAKRKVEDKLNQRADQELDEAIEQAEDSIECLATDKECIAEAEKAGKSVVLTDDDGNPLPADQQPAAPPKATVQDGPVEPMQGVWANFDFVPGNRVIFYEDFLQDNVGDFPRRWGFESGNWDIVEWQGTRFLRSEGHIGAWISINLPEKLPQRWTFEMDFIFSHPVEELGQAGIAISFDKEHAEYAANEIVLRPYSAGLYGGDEGAPHTDTQLTNLRDNRPNRVMLLGDGTYLKIYVNDKRIANVPNARLRTGDKIWIGTFTAPDPFLVYIGNIRVAASDKKIYDALTANGRLALQGIYFDTGSDQLRPESTGTLKEIGQMLKEHPELRLMIEGHTDNVGGEAPNLALSEKRAAAVRQFLIETFAVDAARLQSKGYGMGKPAAPNDTPEGRQTNRRVEIVKL